MESNELKYHDRYVGVPSEDKDDAIKNANNYVETVGTEKIEAYEIDKTEQDIEIINFCRTEIEKLVREYGREKIYSLPIDNIHVLREGGVRDYTNGKLVRAGHGTKINSVIIDRLNSDVQFALNLFHEFVHNYSYKAIQKINAPGGRVKEYREGVSVTNRKGDYKYFEDLEEAIIGLLVKRFYENVLSDHELFREELKKMETSGQKPDTSRIEELSRLNEFLDMLYDANADSFESRDEIERLFINAQINGNLLKIGKLIERTRGKGSFRELGMNSGYNQE